MRYPEHAPSASCHDGDLPSTVSRIHGSLSMVNGLSSRLREGVCGRGALGAKDEGQLTLGREVAFGVAERGARPVQLQGTEVVLLEEAVVTAEIASLGHAAMLHFSPPNRTGPIRKSRTFH